MRDNPVGRTSYRFSLPFHCGAFPFACGLLLCLVQAVPAAPLTGIDAHSSGSDLVAWSTNAPAVFGHYKHFTTNIPLGLQIYATNHPGFDISKHLRPTAITNRVFDHFIVSSLNNLVWTNFIAHTNGRSMRIWSKRFHPAGWPAKAPVVNWDTNCLMWGMKGLTALSPCWEQEGNPGQVPITALTRRHGYARGHGMGPDGFRKSFAGKKVWFCTTNDLMVQRMILREVVRTRAGKANTDYTIVLFDQDLPDSIQPLRVVALATWRAKYPARSAVPWPIFGTEQGGNVSAEVPGFTVSTRKGGDSGSPDMLPMPGELVFIGGRSTSGPTPEMQADMNKLCQMEGLNPRKYQLQWADLSGYPTY